MEMLFIFRRWSWSNKKLCEICCWLLNTTIHNCLGFFLNLDKSSYGIIGPLKTSKTGSSLPMHFSFRSKFFLCVYTFWGNIFSDIRFYTKIKNILWRENFPIWFSFFGTVSAQENPFLIHHLILGSQFYNYYLIFLTKNFFLFSFFSFGQKRRLLKNVHSSREK